MRCDMRVDRQLIRQFIFYGVIGFSSALLDFLLFTLLFKIFEINKYFANGISIHAGIAMSFILNRKFNFKKTNRTFFRAVSFYLTGLFGLILSQGLLWIGGVFIFPVITVKFVSIIFVAAFQFTLNKLITFG